MICGLLSLHQFNISISMHTICSCVREIRRQELTEMAELKSQLILWDPILVEELRCLVPIHFTSGWRRLRGSTFFCTKTMFLNWKYLFQPS